MTTIEAVREGWRKKGIVGHCPTCHRRDWKDVIPVALDRADGEGSVKATALTCGHCGSILLVAEPVVLGTDT